MIVDGQSSEAIAAAADRLRAGDLVVFPTETVYGLGADAGSDAAVAGIFRAKGRPSDHPLIVHVAAGAKGTQALSHFAQPLPPFAEKLVRAFWPGPLTLIVTRQPGVGAAAAGGQDTIGLRCPAHAVAQALLEACAERGVLGLAGPSANRFGRVSPTTAQHVQDEFGDELLIVDGGACAVGIESTIVDCSRGAPVLLRPGAITRDQVEAACGEPLRDKADLAAPDPRASGTLEAHYAPDAKVRLMDAKALQSALDVLGAQAAHIAVWARSPLKSRSQRVLQRRMPDDAATAAQQLFAVLRGFDAEGAKLIWIETPPDTPEWEGVRDRLQRAAAA
ncbi:L-threonylcarbamoyladenylate synthase [Variovorax arabinosiphilus]|uniref:L-threonylcarbamoyladenylate synthase n=1 Tax=Variovorax arabinosiphilus TaxID=3053498 RepID=UPI0025767009|nr:MULTISPECIES: L-threonylcarbamoyladenylate synthase [unclassified Variovorax]MDM0121854.1 L-threonylcarbamoyladenylate synthase [Variovorax sp. J2L1-78]MDM0131616.1 L-threonylcarbamoyladenylate synthase [Variovorax sp. J2L1-63]MDM0234617.1 L-threonylcarbamoyladenylate synthase [Variovorax sp. J2R1-6]